MLIQGYTGEGTQPPLAKIHIYKVKKLGKAWGMISPILSVREVTHDFTHPVNNEVTH